MKHRDRYTDRILPLATLIGNQENIIRLPQGMRFRAIDMRMTAKIQIGAAPAADPHFAGLLAYIRRIATKVNGSADLFPNTGVGLYADHLDFNGVAPKVSGGLPTAANTAETTVTCDFTYYFWQPRLTDTGNRFGFDTQPDEKTGPIVSSDLHIDAGTVSDLYGTVGDAQINSVTVQPIARRTVILPKQGVTPYRARRWDRRFVNKTFTESGIVEVDIPRIERTALIGLVAIQHDNGKATPFNASDQVELRYDEEKWRRPYIWSLRAEAERQRFNALPTNMISISDLVPSGIEAAAIRDADLINNIDLKLFVPVTHDAGGSATQNLTVMAVYAY